MRILIYLFIFLVLFLLQTTFMELLSIKGFKPDLLLIGLVFLTLKEGQISGTVAGFFIGLLQDIYITNFFGLSALSKSLAGFIVGYFSKKRGEANFYFMIKVFFLTTIIHDLLVCLIFFLGSGFGVLKIIFGYVLPRTSYTLVTGMIINGIIPKNLWLK